MNTPASALRSTGTLNYLITASCKNKLPAFAFRYYRYYGDEKISLYTRT